MKSKLRIQFVFAVLNKRDKEKMIRQQTHAEFI